MTRKRIVHIYYNTSGNSGLYLNPIKDALETKFDQTFFVNYYYPLKTQGFKKCFFRLTEKNENNSNKIILKYGEFRKVIRFAELMMANYEIIKFLKSYKPDAINYSLTNMPDALSFLHKIKKALPQCKIIVTCHDVVPFQATKRIDYQGIYDFADFLLVHTTNAIEILKNTYHIDQRKIQYHPFPLIDLSLLDRNELGKTEDNHIPHFLFIGVIRKEKGVQTLIDAWEKLGSDFKAKLHIAGFKPEGIDIDVSKVEKYSNFKMTLKSLSDKEYLEAIEEADYVVFPYSQVGNSGVLSTVVSLGKVPVTTQLPTFLESEYCLSELSCESNNPMALADLLKKITQSHKEKYLEEVAFIMQKLSDCKKNFAEVTWRAYEKMLNDEE